MAANLGTVGEWMVILLRFYLLFCCSVSMIKRPVPSPSPFYPASVVLFQLHGGMISHKQVLPTPSSTVHNTKYLDPYH